MARRALLDLDSWIYRVLPREGTLAGVGPRDESVGGVPLQHTMSIPVEYASARRIRERNKLYYRFNHWPIWIFVFGTFNRRP